MIKKIVFIFIIILLYVTMARSQEKTTLLEVIIPSSAALESALAEQFTAFQLKHPDSIETTRSNDHIRLLLIGRVLDNQVKEYEKAIANAIRRHYFFTIPFLKELDGNGIALIKSNPLEVGLTYEEPEPLTKLSDDLRHELDTRQLPYRGLLFSSHITIGTITDLHTLSMLNQEIELPKIDLKVESVYLVKNGQLSNRYWLKR